MPEVATVLHMPRFDKTLTSVGQTNQKKTRSSGNSTDPPAIMIIRENYVGEVFMKNGLLYRKHQKTKTGPSSNHLVVPKGL